jgi:nucleotide-binding universal stress UspA family protein
MPIVCGVDFSDLGQLALQGAGALASCTREDVLYLVHVLDTKALTRLTVEEQAQLRADVGERLAAGAFELSKRFGLAHVHPTVLVGSPSSALVEFAEFNSASWVVVASRGHGASPLYRLGGTSERVAAESRVPVLVIRDSSAFEAWARRERPLRIVIGVDWTQSSDPAITAVKGLRQSGACDVVVAHVYYPEEAAARYGLVPAHSSIEGDPRMTELLSRDLARRVGELGGTGRTSFRPSIGVGRIGDHLLRLVDAEIADLLVVGTHHRHDLQRLASVSSVALHLGSGSIACVPQPMDHPSVARGTVRRVLVAADLSSYHVAEQAYAIARNGGGEVHLVHVVSNGEGREDHAFADGELMTRIRSLAPQWASQQGIVTHTEIVQSRDRPRAIIETAARIGADVICVGSHAKAGILRRHLGSIAKTIIQHSTLPVLIVRPLAP